MPNLRGKNWSEGDYFKPSDAQFFEDHLFNGTSEEIDQLKEQVNELDGRVTETENVNSEQDKDIRILKEAALGKLYTQETTTSYSNDVTIPSGALSLATLDMLGGASRKGKNLLNCNNLSVTTKNNITFTPYYVNGELQYINVDGTASNWASFVLGSFYFESGKQYIMSGCFGGSNSTYYISYNADPWYTNTNNENTTISGSNSVVQIILTFKPNSVANNVKIYPMLRLATETDNTYEPYTPNLIDGKVSYLKFTIGDSEYAPYKETHKPIPSSVLSLPNYGIGINQDVYNYLEFKDGKVLYHERVGVVNLGTLYFTSQSSSQNGRFDAYVSGKAFGYPNLLCSLYNAVPNANMKNMDIRGSEINSNIVIIDERYNNNVSAFKSAISGVMLYYELATETITDVTDLFPLNFNELEVEANGHISFHYDNDYKVDIPNTISYLIDIQGALNG